MYDEATTQAQWHEHDLELMDDWLKRYDQALQQLYGDRPMANLDDMVQSKSNFMKKEDVGEEGKNLTIRGFKQENVGTESQPEMRYVVVWAEENYKPMVLNVTNKNRLKTIFRTSDTDAMIGKVVNVYNDPFVEYAGEMKGGIRVRPTKQAQAQAMGQEPQQAPQQDNGPPTPPVEAYDDSDIPGFE